MGTFETYIDAAGQFRFRLKAANGEIILKSEGYTSKPARDTGVESVRANAPDDAHYVRKESAAGHSFNLKAANGQVIGTSEVYTNAQMRDKGIESVKANAPGAKVVEME